MSAPPAPANLTDALVFSYLQKRGYSAAAAALPPSAKLPAASDADRERAQQLASEMAVANRITLFEGADDYIGSYQRLRDWAHGSLDLYKARLSPPAPLPPPRPARVGAPASQRRARGSRSRRCTARLSQRVRPGRRSGSP